jgi:16S rRNA (adenine1518-N6/adenine1519-N6)-dimethyltransferase
MMCYNYIGGVLMFKNDTDYLDQHFLIDKEVINNFIDLCNISKNDYVIEVGPGKGVITEKLCKKSQKVLAIELDDNLKPYLNELKKKYDNLDILYGNVLEVFIPKCDKIVTALPYSIIEPFINKLIKCEFSETYMIMGMNYIKSIKENEDNKLSLLTRAYFNVDALGEIEPNAFEPKPRVKSGIIKLTKKELDKDDDLYLIRELFFYRDKLLKNALKETIIKKYNCTQKEALNKIEVLNIDKSLLTKKFEEFSNKDVKNLLEALNGKI